MGRLQAIAIGQALLDAKWLECVTSQDQIFRDEYALYRAGEVCHKPIKNYENKGNAPPQR